jgi:hypothetical protein
MPLVGSLVNATITRIFTRRARTVDKQAVYDTNRGMGRIIKTKFMVVISVCALYKMTGVKFISIEKLKVHHQDRIDYGGMWVEK